MQIERGYVLHLSFMWKFAYQRTAIEIRRRIQGYIIISTYVYLNRIFKT